MSYGRMFYVRMFYNRMFYNRKPISPLSSLHPRRGWRDLLLWLPATNRSLLGLRPRSG